MNIQSYISLQFENNLKTEGLLWRVANSDVFGELLIEKARTLYAYGINQKIALDTVIISVKALLNNNLGIKAFTPDYRQLNKELFDEQPVLNKEFSNIIDNALNNMKSLPSRFSLATEKAYYQYLMNLDSQACSSDLFKNVLNNFLFYLQLHKEEILLNEL